MNSKKTVSLKQSTKALKLIFCICLLAIHLPLIAQESANFGYRNYQKAHEILNAAISSHGGYEEMTRIKTLALDFKGEWTSIFNNVYPDFTKTLHPREGFTIFDEEKEWLYYEEQYERPGVWTSWHRYLIQKDSAFDVNLSQQTHRPESVGWIRRWSLQLPHRILMEAKNNTRTLRYLGPTENNQFHLVSYSNKEGRSYTLYIDQASSLLVKREHVGSYYFMGDLSVLYEFGDYTSIGNIKVPGFYRKSWNGNLRDSFQLLNYRLNEPYNPSLFEIPDNLIYHDWSKEPERMQEVVQHGENIYTLEKINGTDYNALIVVFDKHLVVFGAAPGTAKSVLEKANELFPEKPIKYLIPLNHGFGQMAGIRDYVAAGIPIAVSDGNLDFVKQIVNNPYTVAPDKLAKNPKRLTLTSIDEAKASFGKEVRLEVANIGPTPKFNEMLVVHFPKERILFQGNAFAVEDFDGKGTISPMDTDEVSVYLYNRINKEKWKVAKILCHEGRNVSIEEFKWAIDNYLPERQKMRPFDLYTEGMTPGKD